MEKVYIAGKITGLENYKELFDAAEKRLKDRGYLVMNPAVLPAGFEWDQYMPICLAMIDACDSIYMLKNWKDSKGACWENQYARDKGLLVAHEEYDAHFIEFSNDYIVLCIVCGEETGSNEVACQSCTGSLPGGKKVMFVLKAKVCHGDFVSDGYYIGSSYIHHHRRYANVDRHINLAKKYTTRAKAEIGADIDFENYLFIVEEIEADDTTY